MKNFIFSNTQNTFNYEFKTDFITGMDNFTVHDRKVTGTPTEDDLIRIGIDFNLLPYTYQQFIAFAATNNFTLTEVDFSANTSSALNTATALSVTTASLAAGTVGVAEVTTATLPTTAGATQGDYMILNNKAGDSFAVWLDIDAAGTVPTGPLFLATTYQIEVDIVGAGTAAQNAALVKTAVELNANWAASFDTITDPATGALPIVNTDLGSITDATVHDAAETGAGSIAVVETTPGSGDYSVQAVSAGGNTAYSYELDATSDPLVAGLTLSSTGLISGIPTTTGTPDIVLKVTDQLGQTAISGALTLTIT